MIIAVTILVVWFFSCIMFGLALSEEYDDTTIPFIEILFVWDKTEEFKIWGRIILCAFAEILFLPISIVNIVIYAIRKSFCFLFKKRR